MAKFVINAAIVEDSQIWLVRKGDCWIFPGGKLEKGETDMQCLEREIMREEMPGVTKLWISPLYGTFKSISQRWGTETQSRVYLADAEGNLAVVSSEILESKKFPYEETYLLKTSDITSRILKKLSFDKYI
jgi:ADP-ribose pyrophosphatase YjhB (NUDIX family)